MQLRDWIRAGAIGGVVTIFLALVGLIGRFVGLNLVGEQITFARLALVSVPFLVGSAITRPRVEAGEVRALPPRTTIVAGAIGGAAAGLVFGLAVVLTDAIGVARLRATVLKDTEPHRDIVTVGWAPCCSRSCPPRRARPAPGCA